MSATTDHISAINNKLQQVLKLYENTKAENSRYKATVERLQKNEEGLKTKLEELQQQNLVLRTLSAPLNDADKKELEQKINVYLRNIDKCISLLAQ